MRLVSMIGFRCVCENQKRLLNGLNTENDGGFVHSKKNVQIINRRSFGGGGGN